MKTIYKYTIKPFGKQITLPVNAEILSAAFQGEDLQLWVLVDPEQIEETRNVEVFATGSPIPDPIGFEFKFISTIFTGPFVFHVFELIKV